MHRHGSLRAGSHGVERHSMLDHPEGATMCRTRLVAAGLAVALLAGACGGDEDHDPAELEDETYSGASVVSEDEPAQDGHARASATPAEEPQQAPAPAVAAPVQLGERFAWCANMQALWDAQDQARAETETAAAAHEAAVGVLEAATDDLDRAEAGEGVDDAYANYVFSTRDYGRVRWHAAALIFSDESTLLGGGLDDSTLQVAIERAREAYRANAAPHTLAVLDYAHQATETAAHSSAHERYEGDQSGPAVEAPEPELVPFDASEAWLRATEALQDALNGVEDAEVASNDTSRAAAAAQAAKNEAEDAAWAIYRAAFFDGEWEALIRDVEAHLAAARSGAEAAEEFAMQALEAQAAAAAAAQAVRAAEQASAAARAVAEQAGATRGADAYWEMRSEAQLPARYYADLSADGAAITAMSIPSYVTDAARAVEEAAWYVARIAADLDSSAVAAFEESLQQSCR